MPDRGPGRETAPAPTETRENILGHLLKIEADASALVDDARAEADRRIAESEKQSRSRYEEAYASKAGALDRAFEEEMARIRADYQEQLAAYRRDLEALPVDQGRFSALMDELLAKGPRTREAFGGRMFPRGC
jgi:F0F1-type ATP synthase membrane subunit b/b'